MTKAIVFFGAALVAASMAPARQASARAVALSPSRIVAALPAALDKSSPGSGSVSATGQAPTAGDRAKRSEAVEERSENVAQESVPLPQTSTILPLLGLIGLGSLVAGLFARR